jgi:hypothetical protein
LEIKPTDDRWQGNIGKSDTGYRYFERLDITRDEIKKAIPNGILTHHLSAGVEKAVEGFLNSGGQITPTTQRIRKGIPMTSVQGMSSTTDVGTGGASYMFTRIATKSQASAGQFIFDIGELARLDAWSFNTDVFGRVREEHVRNMRKTSVADFKSLTQHYGNETLFKNGFDMITSVKYIVVESSQKQDVIDIIKKHGITKWGDGRPLEQVVVTAPEVKP